MQPASSITGLTLTTEAKIADSPEEKDGGIGCGMPGGMGGIGMGM